MRAINSTKSFKISDVFLRSQYRREMVRLYDKVISTLQPPDTYYLILFIFKVDVFFYSSHIPIWRKFAQGMKDKGQYTT